MTYSPKNPSHSPRIRWRRWLVRALYPVVILGLLATCQSRMIYFPRRYAEGAVDQFLRHPGAERLSFVTKAGSQAAFLLKPKATPAERLWIVCLGNASLALDGFPFIRDILDPRDAYLFLDYPGYGECEGAPSPATIRENGVGAIPLALAKCGIPSDEAARRLRIFGHSLGCAACLIVAKEFGITRGVLLSPFTSTMDMAKVALKLPLGFLLWHRFDNKARILELKSQGAVFHVLHGTQDEVIPVWMSHELQRECAPAVKFQELPRASHNDIFSECLREIAQAMASARD